MPRRIFQRDTRARSDDQCAELVDARAQGGGLAKFSITRNDRVCADPAGGDPNVLRFIARVASVMPTCVDGGMGATADRSACLRCLLGELNKRVASAHGTRSAQRI
jgi:hypothetical protein